MLSLISMSGTPLEHQTRRSQTAIALAVCGGRKSPRAHSITGLPTAVSLTRADICEKIFLLLLSFILFLKGFTAFQTVDIKLHDNNTSLFPAQLSETVTLFLRRL